MADETDFDNLDIDIATIGNVANGAEDLNGNGTVETRLGQVVKTLARAIRDIALNGMYVDIATGLAATVNGEYFAVAGTGDVYATLYRNNAGSELQIAQYASKAFFDDMIANFTRVQVIGQPVGASLSDGSTSVAGSTTYAFSEQLVSDGILEKIEVGRINTTAGNLDIKIKRFSGIVGNLLQQGSNFVVTTTNAGGTQSFDASVAVNEGERLGLSGAQFSFSYVASSSPNDSGGWYADNTDDDTTITDTVTSALELNVRFSVRYFYVSADLLEDIVSRLEAAELQTASIQAQIDALLASFVVEPSLVYEMSDGNLTFAQGVGFSWSVGARVGYELEADVPLAYALLMLNPPESSSVVHLELFERDLATGATSGAGSAGDILIASINPDTVANLGMTADVINSQILEFANGYKTKAGKGYLLKGYTKDGGGNFVSSGIERGPAVTAGVLPDWVRGHYTGNAAFAANNTYTAVGGVGTTATIRCALYTSVYKFADSESDQLKSFGRLANQASEPSVSLTTQSVTLPTIKLSFAGEEFSYSNLTAVIDNPVVNAGQSQNAFSLVYGTIHDGSTSRLLPYQYVKDVVVTRVSDSSVLTRGVEYQYDETRGSFWGIPNIAAYSVNIAYAGMMHRYDAVVMDRKTKVVSVIKGTDRAIDPEHYKPVVPAGKILLYWAYVYFDVNISTVYAKVELIEAMTWRPGYFHIKEDRAGLIDKEYNRQMLKNSIRRLRSGDPFKHMAYGTSIGAISGGITPIVDVNAIPIDNVQINANRDRDSSESVTGGVNGSASDYIGRFPSDTCNNAAIVPTFLDTDYPANDWDAGVHIKIGWNWWLLAELEKKFGRFDLQAGYRNLSIGATTSANTFENGRLNGAHTKRLDAAVAEAPHLTVIDFLMNDVGTALDTYANLTAIISRIRGETGSDIILIAGPQVMQTTKDGRATESQWNAKTNEIIEAAIDNKVGFYSSRQYMSPGYLGGAGLSLRSMCNANAFNHPGPEQLKHDGLAMATIFY